MTPLFWVFHVGLILGTGSDSPQPPCHYYHFHDKLPLQLDGGRIAIHHPGHSIGTTETTLRSRVALTGMRARAIADWSLADLGGAKRDLSGMAQIVHQISASDGIEFVSPTFIDGVGGAMNVTPEILVGFNDDVTPERAEGVLAEIVGGHILEREFGGMKGAYRLRSSSKDGFEVLAAANALAQRAEVKYAEPDMIFTGRSDLVPNDPGFGLCWGLHNTGQSGGTVDMDMDAPEAWDFTIGSPSIIVVIIDVGVQQDHPDINQLTPGTDTTGQGGDGGPLNACDNHGTAVAGCVSASINNSLGTVGVAPGCRSASARTFISNVPCDGMWDSQASMTVSSLVWAQAIGARVTNNSNYYGFTSSAIDSKYAETRNAGIVHFASAGNDASTTITYPASLSTVNAVAALNRNGNLASFSNHGGGLDFSAPGQAIYSTDRTGALGYSSGDYATLDGTSFASPYSAGVAALILSLNSNLTAIQVELFMQQSCVNLGAPGYDTTFGWGFVNAFNALALVSNADTITPVPNPMSFSLPPAPLSATSIAMQASEATDANSPPVQYFFDYVSGAGGSDSGWQASRDYINEGLTPNSPFTYRVKARDSATPNQPNETAYSSTVLSSTAIETPAGVAFSNVTGTSFTVDALGTFTNIEFGSTGFYFELSPPDGSGANDWVTQPSISVTGLSPCTTYTVQVKARNFQGYETPFGSSLNQATSGCVLCTLMGDVDNNGVRDGLDVAALVRIVLGAALPTDNPACADYQTGTLEGDVAAFVVDLLNS